MKKYISLYIQFIKNSFIFEAQYRVNLITHVITDLVGIGVTLLSVEILFNNVPVFGGWSYHEVLLLIGISHILRGLYFGPLIANLGDLVNKVNSGRLDFVLLKPISSQFFVSTRRIRLFTLSSLFTGIAILLVGLNNLQTAPTPEQIFLFLFLIFCSFIICYTLWFISVVPAVWFPRLWAIHETFLSLFNVTEYPPGIFPNYAKYTMIFLIPLLVLSVYPAKALTGELQLWEALSAPTAAALLLFISNKFWHFALKHYQSASS